MKAIRTAALLFGLALIVVVVWAGTSSEAGTDQRSRTVAVEAEEPPLPPEFTRQFQLGIEAPNPIPKAPGLYTATDWAEVIDATWGSSPLSPFEQTGVFLDFWNEMDDFYACFQDLDVDWDAVKAQYLSELSSGVSKGRFSAIMNHTALALRDGHTTITDLGVSQTQLAPGIPVMVPGGWGHNGHFGAGVTPLPDKSLLVYKARANHPLGLVAGDVVLGYDGKPWSQLYQELLEAELPLRNFWWWGSSDSSHEHSWLMSGGLNWHLFDTIDIVKHDTGALSHFPTPALVGQTEVVFATEQLPVPGVPMPDPSTEVVSWGIIEGTQIGYIYQIGWYFDAQQAFYDALYALTVEQETSGLIVDFRTNYGGNMFLSNLGLSLLFDSTVTTIGFDQRCDPDDHLAMCAAFPPSTYVIPGNPATYYDKPIAVLVGPGAISSGDQVALRFKFHPEAHFFGKSTTTAFNAPVGHNVGYPGWDAQYAFADAYLVSEPTNYLTHDEFEVDCSVWLTPEDVAQGQDTVVNAAIEWILDIQSDADNDQVGDPCDNCPTAVNPDQANADGDPAGDACDCDSNDPGTYPGAPEVNDGFDNQCPGDAGYGVADETSGDSGFHSSDKNEYSWTAQIGATLYEVARSSQPDFSGDCTVLTTPITYWTDTEHPSPGVTFYYLNRPLAPNPGSWGVDSSGAERTSVCL